MVVGVERIDIFIDGNRSLKGKRQVVKRLIERIRSNFGNVSIAEVDSHDLWQKATLGISVVSNEVALVNSILDQVINFIEFQGTVQILERKFEIIHF